MSTRMIGQRGSIIGPLLVTAALLAGCSTSGSVAGTQESGGQKPDLSLPTTATVMITDPVEDSFTVEVPEGWSSVAYATGQFDVHREIVRSISPDGNTILFLGDPKIPNFWNPATADALTVQFADTLAFMELQPYTRAEDYFALWAEVKFGTLPGFDFVSFESDDGVVAGIQQQYVDAGLSAPRVDAVDLRFRYDADDVAMNGRIVGVTIDGGNFWTADVNGMVTDRDIDDYFPMVTAMSQTKHTKQSYIDRQNAHNAETAAQMQAFSDQMTAQHNANMAAIQASAAAHQAHMQAIWASNDASFQAWNTQMAASDYNQQQFLNYINDEYTVAAPSGQTFQVDDGYQTYYMNTHDQSYVAGDVNFGENELLALGLNPSDYELVEVLNGPAG